MGVSSRLTLPFSFKLETVLYALWSLPSIFLNLVFIFYNRVVNNQKAACSEDISTLRPKMSSSAPKNKASQSKDDIAGKEIEEDTAHLEVMEVIVRKTPSAVKKNEILSIYEEMKKAEALEGNEKINSKVRQKKQKIRKNFPEAKVSNFCVPSLHLISKQVMKFKSDGGNGVAGDERRFFRIEIAHSCFIGIQQMKTISASQLSVNIDNELEIYVYVKVLVGELERELQGALSLMDYKKKMKIFVENMKDPDNHQLRSKILKREFTGNQICRMKDLEMMSAEKQKIELENYRKIVGQASIEYENKLKRNTEDSLDANQEEIQHASEQIIAIDAITKKQEEKPLQYYLGKEQSETMLRRIRTVENAEQRRKLVRNLKKNLK